MSEHAKSTVFTKTSLFEFAAKNSDRTYISIHENVFDVTQFLEEHPGGEEALKEHQIKKDHFRDATEAFEDVGHSMDARDLMKKFQIGVLENKKEKPAPKVEVKEEVQTGGGFPSWIFGAVALVALGIAYQYFTHRQ